MSHAQLTEALDALFLSPHPDDVELFCGGSVARLVSQGATVAIVDMTAGEKASNGSVEGRREESLLAARALGLTRPRLVLGLPDGGVDDRDEEQLRAVVELLRKLRPRMLFAPHPQDRHPDHEAAGRLARRATVLTALTDYPSETAPHPVQLLCEYPCHWMVPPSFLVDVSSQMAQRRNAVAAYRSQFIRGETDTPTPINHPKFLERNEDRLREWGAGCGVEFAEGFVVESPPSVDQLRPILGGSSS